METSLGRTGKSSASTSSDPIAMMEYYVKKAAQEERRRQPKNSKDEMPPPASLQGNVKKDNLGVGAQQPGEMTPEDDIYEQYKKLMMLGYCHRPNPLELILAPLWHDDYNG
ncbi:SURP and G-patch domain-containing protein 1-like protein isoform X1 [Argentina anserina]|uniref:SURP and G-patch domain-containing protein 1-like protein isoform X1 n=2 Tax=Argentina anserina TaxID=57926 RepID=UPI0021766F60|nr:SURP and G-patch domain-containing protein 1-like protein isoform X1 [Potentilla anserina]